MTINSKFTTQNSKLVAQKGKFRRNSDIDLAVSGLKSLEQKGAVIQDLNHFRKIIAGYID